MSVRFLCNVVMAVERELPDISHNCVFDICAMFCHHICHHGIPVMHKIVTLNCFSYSKYEMVQTNVVSIVTYNP